MTYFLVHVDWILEIIDTELSMLHIVFFLCVRKNYDKNAYVPVQCSSMAKIHSSLRAGIILAAGVCVSDYVEI